MIGPHGGQRSDEEVGGFSGWTVSHVYPPHRGEQGVFGKGSWEDFDNVCVLNSGVFSVC